MIDLSADYRFSDVKVYERVYGHRHKKIVKAVYGLPELFRNEIKNAKIVANPGCYATASILAGLPIQKFVSSIIFDCKSGYSGAGIKPTYVNQKENYTDNIIPYNITKHRHKYEIEQFIKSKVSFTPHVIPTFRGLMCTMHAILDNANSPKDSKLGEFCGIEMSKIAKIHNKLLRFSSTRKFREIFVDCRTKVRGTIPAIFNKKTTDSDIKKIYKQFYKNEPFVRIMDKIPELHDVQNTNYCCLGGFEIDENNQLVVISVIDNLLKGASGQAVQNMNIMFGIEEGEGLL